MRPREPICCESNQLIRRSLLCDRLGSLYRCGLQAYFPKKPGNFGQHFLETCHGNRPRSVVDLHQYYMEKAPHQKKIEKKFGVAKSTFSPWKSHFFAGGNTLISLRAQRAFLEIFCGLVVQRDAISRSVSKPQKNPRALCQSNVTILKRFQGSTRRQSERITDFFRFFETISSTIDCARALTPRE